MYIEEIIVVEGKDDVAAVKRACAAEVIITNGLGITPETLDRIRIAHKRKGVIILTDPDYPGEKIRKIIDRAVPGCKHAYLETSQKLIGVEYAAPEEILQALKRARSSEVPKEEIFSVIDLCNWGLLGCKAAAASRRKVAKQLGLGQANGKQFLARLNGYGISREEVVNALELHGGRNNT